MKNNTRVTLDRTTPRPCSAGWGLFGDPTPSHKIHRASPGTGQNQESSCGIWLLVTHLDNERHVQKDLDQLRRWSAVGDRPERVRNASCHLSGQQKRSGCCRLKCCAVAPTTSTGARQAYCGARVPVGCLEGDRSGRGETEKVQPATRDGDTYRVTIVANSHCPAPLKFG